MMRKITLLSLILGGVLCLAGYGILSVIGKNETSRFKDEKLEAYDRKGEEVIKPSAVLNKPIIMQDPTDNTTNEFQNTRGTKDDVEMFLKVWEQSEETAI